MAEGAPIPLSFSFLCFCASLYAVVGKGREGGKQAINGPVPLCLREMHGESPFGFVLIQIDGRAVWARSNQLIRCVPASDRLMVLCCVTLSFPLSHLPSLPYPTTCTLTFPHKHPHHNTAKTTPPTLKRDQHPHPSHPNPYPYLSCSPHQSSALPPTHLTSSIHLSSWLISI